MQHTHSNTNWGTMDSALAPPLTGQPPPLNINYLCCLHVSAFLSPNPLISLLNPFSVLFSFCQVIFHHPHFPAGWVQSVLTPFTSEGSPWSAVPVFPPAKPSSTEVIHCSLITGAKSVVLAHTQTRHTAHTGVPFKGKRRRKRRDSPKGESLLVV